MENENIEVKEEKKSKKKKIIIICIVVALIIINATVAYILIANDNKEKINNKNKEVKSEYRITSNDLTDFDLYFMKLENNGKNKIYSPLSIKYALEMLSEGAKGDTKSQIDNIIGEYKANKYANSENMSFANAMFIRNSFKDSIKKSYTDKLNKKYNAEIIYDSFNKPDKVNNWVSDKTFKLINNLVDDVSSFDFILVNALAIDMEWKKVIQARNFDDDTYSISYVHEKAKGDNWTYSHGISPLDSEGYHPVKFNNGEKDYTSVQIGASANKYDIIKELGEDKIRSTVKTELEKWLDSKEGKDFCKDEFSKASDECSGVDKYVEKYIKDISSNYKKFKTSTDFSFYNDEKVKAFAKDLKEYNGTTLEYVGIMPKDDTLVNFVKNNNSHNINKIINSLKESKYDNFEDGVVTKVTGFIPVFKYDYELKLQEDLEKLGVKNIFDSKKADLSNIVEGAYIGEVKHKANIEFTNEGIKAAAVTMAGGLGATGGGFDYLFEIPTKEINLTFDKPYMYIIRDKKTGEVWFAGTVYEPTEFEQPVW